jgi:hypothetical protein
MMVDVEVARAERTVAAFATAIAVAAALRVKLTPHVPSRAWQLWLAASSTRILNPRFFS